MLALHPTVITVVATEIPCVCWHNFLHCLFIFPHETTIFPPTKTKIPPSLGIAWHCLVCWKNGPFKANKNHLPLWQRAPALRNPHRACHRRSPQRSQKRRPMASHGDFLKNNSWDDSIQMTLKIYGRIWKILFPRLPVTSSDFQPPNLPNQLVRRCDWKSRDLDWPFWFLVLAARIF